MNALTVRKLRIAVPHIGRVLVRDVDLDIPPDAIVGVVGESGSGKSMISLSLMGILPEGVRVTGGTVALGNGPAQALTAETSAAIRSGAAMIFQNPRSALNPTMRVGRQIERVLRRRLGLTRSVAASETEVLLQKVGIFDTSRVRGAYPHQLSGGMSQRVMIAMALATSPRLLIADEPTTGLDVTIQAQILQLLRGLAESEGCSVMLITHDLAVVSAVSTHTVVLFGGQLMEAGPTVDVFSDPAHPYTRFLLDAIGRVIERDDAAGDPGGLDFELPGCRFAGRCAYATERCRNEIPLPRTVEGRTTACHHAEEVIAGAARDR